ncbi:hypothetical protein DQM28_13015 [Leptospira mayottensis]|uniref:Uncharacterized protein n=1 Tax=Leptospira mayottensis TaxID=1137606 RepID=A0ABM6YAF8_9LEPT|nr:hypothetical protein DQM28_13015 [Leptospira mayottensis]
MLFLKLKRAASYRSIVCRMQHNNRFRIDYIELASVLGQVSNKIFEHSVYFEKKFQLSCFGEIEDGKNVFLSYRVYS